MRANRMLLVAGVCLQVLPAWAQRPLGVDVSSYQGSINWSQVAATGRTYAVTKATEGTGYFDAYFVSNMTNARAAGIYIGCYDFCHPESNSPTTEANYFVSKTSGYITPGYFRPFLDLEVAGGITPVGAANLSDWTNAWINAVKAQTGVEPMIYCNTNYASNYLNSSVNTRTLWIANYNGQDPQTGNPGTGVWATWDFWQYISTGTVSGISGNVDHDVFHYTSAQIPNYVIPSIIRSPSTLTQTATFGLNPASQSFTIRNGVTGISVPLNYVISSNAAWLTTSPANGTSTGETDTITVNYTSSALSPGSYSATLTITNGTNWYTPVTIAVSLTVSPITGDLNQDGKVNDQDVAIFLGCMTGSKLGPPVSGCQIADLDRDNDVDISDFGMLQRCMNGYTAPVPNCAN